MQPRDAHRVQILLLCTAAIVARLAVGAHIVDDAYITMRYSRNLSSTGILSYNPPDAVLGTSSPLWTWILAAGQVAGVPPETTATVVATVADLSSILLIMASPVGGSLAALIAAATIAAWPAYVTYAVSGMETSLFVLTIVAFVTALGRERGGFAAVAASMAALCRPDGALVVVLGFAWTLVTVSRVAALRFIAAAALICAPWIVYAFVRFGSFIPASVSAKASAADPWVTSLVNVQAYFVHGVYTALTICAIAGFVLIAQQGPAFWRVWSLWAWAYLLAMTAANGFTHFPWYFVPLLPIYTGAAALAIERALARAEIGGRYLSQGAGRVAATAAMSVLLLSRMPALKAHLESNEAGRETLYASVATTLAAVDSRCTIAATEIGTLGYHYPGRVLDLVGLVSPEVIGRPVGTVLADSRTRWLVTYDTHFDRAVADTEPFTSLFERRSTVRVGEARSLEIYERRAPVRCGQP